MGYFNLYFLPVLVASLFSIVLSITGVHLATRGRALYGLVLSQSAIFGISLFILLFPSEEPLFTTFLGSLVVTGLVILFLEYCFRSFSCSQQTFLISTFTTLMASTYWIVSYFPSLEPFSSRAFFGDIVTFDGFSLKVGFFIFLVGAIYLFIFRKTLFNSSFNLAILGEDMSVINLKYKLFFPIWVWISLSTSIFLFGQLFSLAFLFIPSLIFSIKDKGTYFLHMIMVSFVSFSSVILGFLLSLMNTRFSTVPTQILFLIFFSLSVKFLMKCILKFRVKI